MSTISFPLLAAGAGYMSSHELDCLRLFWLAPVALKSLFQESGAVESCRTAKLLLRALWFSRQNVHCIFLEENLTNAAASFM